MSRFDGEAVTSAPRSPVYSARMYAADPLPARVRFGLPRLSVGWLGAILLLAIAVPCLVTLPWSLERYALQDLGVSATDLPPRAPSTAEPLGSDALGRSLLWRSLLGGAISLGIGVAAACIAVFIGVAWGALAGYIGGRVDSAMMRIVDVLYGLPYILLVVLLDMALSPLMVAVFRALPGVAPDVASGLAEVVTLLVAIGGVSWLTMARVIRGQVLSLRAQPFIEAARALGMGPVRILRVHLLPNLIGPIVVYTTLTVPAAILQESFLSFLGIGVQAPLPSWGNLAAEGVGELPRLGLAMPPDWSLLFSSPPGSWQTLLGQLGGLLGAIDWWLLVFPCLLLGLTLMGLNFVGDALRNRLDPRTTRSA